MGLVRQAPVGCSSARGRSGYSISYTALDTEAIQVVRGSAVRTLRTVGGGFALGNLLLLSGLWLFAKNSSATKIAVSAAMIGFAGVVLLCACLGSSFTIAEVRDRRLNFYFCGIRTRSIPLDASTVFELRTIGRLKVLSIRSSGSSYVPNGALNIQDVLSLLRANGVAERKAV
jgi:uncharacterized membrane protein YbhN (UPF0104 family)